MGATLIFSSVGFLSQEVPVGSNPVINIKLPPMQGIDRSCGGGVW